MVKTDAELDDLRLLINCPRLYISNFFNGIKAEIDIFFNQQLFSLAHNEYNKKEKSRELTETWIKTIKRLETYETECLNNEKKLKFKVSLIDQINRYIDLIGSRLTPQNQQQHAQQSCQNKSSTDKQNSNCMNRIVIEYEIKKENDPLRQLIRNVTLKIERILFMERTIFFRKTCNQIGKLICIKNHYVSKQMLQFLKNEESSKINQTISNELLKCAYLNELIKLNLEEDLAEHKPMLNEVKFECNTPPQFDKVTNHLPTDLFNGFSLSLTDVDLSNNQIISLDANVFTSCVSLKFIDLSFNQIACINNRLFSGLKSLIIINLSHNELTTIDKNTFAGLKCLETINLSNNHLAKIDCQLFNDLSNLEEIYLYNNLVTSIDFSNASSKLRTINVSNNLINSLPMNCFAGLNQLRYIGLACNILTELKPNVFDGLIKLETIDLAGNRISKIDDHVFHGLSSLNKVDLSYNELKSIDSQLFKGLSNLKRIYLPNNKISFDEKLMLNIEKSVEFVSFKNQSQNDIKLIV